MDGFVISGKAFVVCEELRALAERNKGLTVAEMLNKRKPKMTESYIGNYVAYSEFGKTKITTKANYEAVIRNANIIVTFDGTIQEAVEYIKQNLGVQQ